MRFANHSARFVMLIAIVAALFSGACASNNGPRFRSAEDAPSAERRTFADCARQFKGYRQFCYNMEYGQDSAHLKACLDGANRAFERCIDSIELAP